MYSEDRTVESLVCVFCFVLLSVYVQMSVLVCMSVWSAASFLTS